MDDTPIWRSNAGHALTRRRWLTHLAGFAGGLAIANRAGAQGNFPDRVVSLILPFPPGAIVDNVGRKLAARLRDEWGQSVISDNRPGAGGNLAGGVVARAPADGYNPPPVAIRLDGHRQGARHTPRL